MYKFITFVYAKTFFLKVVLKFTTRFQILSLGKSKTKLFTVLISKNLLFDTKFSSYPVKT